jgi:hypothetical protein
VRHQATASAARLTAPGGTLLVIAAGHATVGEPQCGPPRPHNNDDHPQGN